MHNLSPPLFFEELLFSKSSFCCLYRPFFSRSLMGYRLHTTTCIPFCCLLYCHACSLLAPLLTVLTQCTPFLTRILGIEFEIPNTMLRHLPPTTPTLDAWLSAVTGRAHIRWPSETFECLRAPNLDADPPKPPYRTALAQP